MNTSMCDEEFAPSWNVTPRPHSDADYIRELELSLKQSRSEHERLLTKYYQDGSRRSEAWRKQDKTIRILEAGDEKSQVEIRDLRRKLDALKDELRELKGLVVHNELDPRP